MDAIGRNRLKINVDSLVNKGKRKKKRDLNEPVHYEINSKKVSVFTPEFLEENRIIEGELRKLRKLNGDFEEHNSVLVKYIDSLTKSCDQASEELRELTEFKELLTAQVSSLKSELKKKYGVTLGDAQEC